MNPPKWTSLYAHGTKEGDEELKFFIILARGKDYTFRSVAALARETGLTKTRIEEFINKYYKLGMIFQNPKNEDQWGYWERVPELVPKSQQSISREDHNGRIRKISSIGDAIEDV